MKNLVKNEKKPLHGSENVHNRQNLFFTKIDENFRKKNKNGSLNAKKKYLSLFKVILLKL